MTGVIVTTVVVLLAAAVVAVLVVGGVLLWYVADAERRSIREFTRIHRPLPRPKSGQIDTGPDGPTGQPFRPIYRGCTPTAPNPATDSRTRKDR
ncbi:hypothetical protein [Amycolatopsis sp. TNS106]|uniref:hypothetical protein n=1 Tax=Amycolatopsis sp. TNS106 TaxID=2861750 RepID=UPI001C5A2107|nr:hypothetical protein [Amycolatopsis sp. TNS106]